jgi:two-component system, chemotaxis family, protein-glutamate methylesterase/glutaminase
VANRQIIVIGTSAGGVKVLSTIIGQLPNDLNAAIFIVLHISPHQPSKLPHILTRAGNLNAVHATDGEPIHPGKIYVAPPDRHLVLEPGRVRVTKGPKENRFRPAIDPLFRSAAYAYGAGVIGVVLTGALDDGTAGLWAIKDRGGIAIVQDPDDAEQRSMPWTALNNVEVDYCLPVSEIAKILVRLTQGSVGPERERGSAVSDKLGIETKIALGADSADLEVAQLGNLSEFTCPECHGTLTEIIDGKLERYRCHTGHAFSNASLLAELTDSVEESLWNSIRAIEERIRLLKHPAQHAAELSSGEIASALSRDLQEAEQQADSLRVAATGVKSSAEQT